jgi:hypothetical protein
MSGPEERKVKSLGELSPGIEPPRDLWPQIEARLRSAPASAPLQAPAARPRRAQLRWLAAAAMVASVAVGVWIGRDFLPLPGTAGTGVVPQTAQVAPANLGAAGALDARYVSDPRYQRDRAELLKTLQARLDAMPPAARQKVTASLATIEQAKQDLEGALGKDPSNALLQELLINTYQDEMRALTDVHDTSNSSQGI